MAVSRFEDKFNRPDGPLGSNWTVACGQAGILDESVLALSPEGTGAFGSGVSPIDLLTDEKTQVLYTGAGLDSPHQTIRAVWGHTETTPDDVNGDPSFTILARATKDPLLLDLGGDEQPLCYDQGYGLRVTCPLAGAAPTLKIVKLSPNRRVGQSPSVSAERDNAISLASITLSAKALNLDPSFAGEPDDTASLPYKGFWQDMRLRITGTDGGVLLEAFLNDRYENNPILSYEDHKDPLWSSTGVPGFEFLSPLKDVQPEGASAFEQAGIACMHCTLFDVTTAKVAEKPRVTFPGNFMTYSRVVDRVIALVEKGGEAQFGSTVSGQTKRSTYLDFVLEAEADIIRREGYFQWLFRDSNIYLTDSQAVYELPEDFGLLYDLRPGNWQGPSLTEVTPFQRQNLTQGLNFTGGKPRMFSRLSDGVNNRPRVRLFPVPLVASVNSSGDPFLVVEYYARRIRPNNPDTQIPTIPQESIDVLIYGAAAHALLLDVDPQAAQAYAAVYSSKLEALRRANNRNVNTRVVMRSSADVKPIDRQTPTLRVEQLNSLLI